VKWQDDIEERPDVMMGKAVFKETRITVEHVLNELSSGMNETELLRGHPGLTADHIRAALAYASGDRGGRDDLRLITSPWTCLRTKIFMPISWHGYEWQAMTSSMLLRFCNAEATTIFWQSPEKNNVFLSRTTRILQG
jgi:uncharacterized protein (DUF433 family)